jgi:hypothetical protein
MSANIKHIRNINRIYDYDYVQNILGIRIPLNESLIGYSLEFERKLIREHILYETMMGSIRNAAGWAGLAVRQTVKDIGQAYVTPAAGLTKAVGNEVGKVAGKVEETGNDIKNLAISFHDIFSDQGLLDGFLNEARTQAVSIAEPISNAFDALINLFNKVDSEQPVAVTEGTSKVRRQQARQNPSAVAPATTNSQTAMDKLRELVKKFKGLLLKANDSFKQYIMAPLKGLVGWQGAMTCATIYSILKWAISKIPKGSDTREFFKTFANDCIKVLKVSSDTSVEINEFVKIVTEHIAKFIVDFAKDHIKTLVRDAMMNTAKAIMPWLETIGAVIGGVATVTSILHPITSKYVAKKADGVEADAASKLDSDHDGIPDDQDLDADGDGISSPEEKAKVEKYKQSIRRSTPEQIAAAKATQDAINNAETARVARSPAAPAYSQARPVFEHADLRTLLKYLER